MKSTGIRGPLIRFQVVTDEARHVGAAAANPLAGAAAAVAGADRETQPVSSHTSHFISSIPPATGWRCGCRKSLDRQGGRSR